MSATDIFLPLLALLIIYYVRRALRRSPLNNLPGPPPAPWLMGHLPQWFDRHGTEFQRQIAQDYGPVVRMQGMMGHPLLYVYDTGALHTMLIKQQSIYEEEELLIRVQNLLFGPGLTAVIGERHRKQRKILNPAFSTAHLRDMLPTFYDIAEKLRDAFAERICDGSKELDVLSWMSRAALEVIAQGGLGVSVDPLTRDTTDGYSQALKELVPTVHSLGALRFVLCIPRIHQLGPAWLRRRIVELMPHRGLQKTKDIVDTLARKSVEIYEDKKAALLRADAETSKQITEGKDLLSLMMRANMAASAADKLSEDELIAQVSLFLLAATDTTSNSMVKILERLAHNQDIQEKLRKELLEAQCSGRPSYDELMRLPILDAVVRETLRTDRRDPLANLFIRQPIKDVVLPLSSPIRGRDGTLMSEIPIPKGTDIIMGVLGHNTNTALWGADANEWKPERWLAPLPDALTEAPAPGVYANLMTFPGGGRSCIGFKFSELEMKAILSVLLLTFKFEMSDKLIVWNVAPVRYPTVGRESKVPQMPMKVILL